MAAAEGHTPARLLYHMCEASTWQDCKERQQAYFPPTYQQDGFIHLSDDPKLLLMIANLFYRDSPGDWVTLELDAAKLTAEVKYEPAADVGDKSSGGALGADERLFPHLFGTIDFAAAVREVPMQRGSDGSFLGIPGLA